MDKKEFERKIKKIVSREGFACVYLVGDSVLYVTNVKLNSLFEGHIRLYMNGETIGHIPLKSIKKVS